jgi:hypothetical protein
MINTDKLNKLREDHDKLRDLYAGLNARARTAQADAVRLRTFSPSIAATPAQKDLANRALALPPAELLALAPGVLASLGLTLDIISRGIEAQRHADSLKSEAENMLPIIHSRGALLTRLNDWARVNT